MPEDIHMGERIFRGIPASAGVCQGKVFIINQAHATIQRREINAAEVSQEIERLEKALVETRRQILEVQHQVGHAMGAEEANIFEAHLLLLEDPFLMEEVTRFVQKENANVEYAFHVVSERYLATLSEIEDEYLRERSKDIRDVTQRVLNNLMGRLSDHAVLKLQDPCIIISDDLTPSMTAQLDRSMTLGFATDTGSKTSHTAILARSLKIPAIVGLQDISRQLRNGQHILVDGFNGLLILNPTDQTLFEYGQLVKRQFAVHERLQELRDKPAITLDGHRVVLAANIEQAADAVAVLASGAEGVGLFRTEYLFINRDRLPTEEEQFQAYLQIATAMKPQPVVIRTLDVGGDKFITHMHLPNEMNPYLGWRAIRFCLQEPEIFCCQLRAILRAGIHGNVKMMFPMISGIDELEQSLAFVNQCKAELASQGMTFDPKMEIGVMIEIPSAVLSAPSLAKRVSFFSLGTNDLIQYSLAVDRLNERIAHLYQPTHPAIIRLIKMSVEAAHTSKIWAGICGEMAGDLALVPLLLGLGIDELSMAASLLPQVKYLIRRIKISEARELADFALHSESSSAIWEKTRAMAMQCAPVLFDDQNQILDREQADWGGNRISFAPDATTQRL